MGLKMRQRASGRGPFWVIHRVAGPLSYSGLSCTLGKECHMNRRFTGSSILVSGSVAVLATLVTASLALGQGSSIPLSAVAQASGAVITRSAGIDFVTIGSAGNAPWMGNGTSGDRAIGRGGVGYEYRIGRFEVTPRSGSSSSMPRSIAPRTTASLTSSRPTFGVPPAPRQPSRAACDGAPPPGTRCAP